MPSKMIQSYFLLAILAAAGILSFLILKPFLGIMVMAAVFAVVLHPLYVKIAESFGGRESLAALATVIISLVIILVPTVILSVRLLSEAQQLYASLIDNSSASAVQDSIVRLGPVVDNYIPGAQARIIEFANSLNQYTQIALTWLIQHLAVAFSSVAAVIFDIFLFFVVLYYLIRDGARLKRIMVRLSPLDNSDDELLISRMRLAINSLVKGKIVVGIVQGVLTGIGFALFGIANPVIWGLVAALASFIPPFGTAMVLAPGVVYLVMVGNLGAAIGLAIWGSIAVGLIDNFLGPYLMSEGLQLHPLLVLFSALGGLAFFGAIGVFLGPLVLSLLLALLSMYSGKHTAEI
jgi:predicted PurR-regulated permease PerM